MNYAHSAKNMGGESIGIIHRDLNPHNLLVSYGGEVKVIDFGIAKSEMAMHKTETGTIKGKFVYMSPEQSAAEELDKRSDIFAIGICLYEAITGTNPFAKANIVLSLDAIQRHDPAPVADADPSLAPFQRIVDKALAKKRDERYSTCGDLRDDLNRLLTTNKIPKAPQSLSEFMRVIYKDQIVEEERSINETDRANTVQVEKMQQAGKHEASGARKKPVSRTDRIDRESPGARRSKGPFLLMLAAIVCVSVVGVLVMGKLAKEKKQRESIIGLTEVEQPKVPKATNIPKNEPAPKPAVAPAATPKQPTAQATSKDRGSKGRGKKNRSSRKASRDTRSSSSTTRTTSGKKATTSNFKPAPPPPPPSHGKVPAVATPKTFGALQISTNPPVRIVRNGKPVGQTLKLTAHAGVLTFGGGTDKTRDPFVVTIRYKIQGDSISYSVESRPWAVVRGAGGMGLGKTPLPMKKSQASTVFELVNPKERLRQRISLRFAP
jgi:serine/threonine protein kinase